MMYANPVKRIRKEHKITQQQLADAGDLQRLTVLRTEQGLYEEVPGAVMQGLIKLVPSLDPRLVADEYGAYQRHQRALYGPLSVGKLRFDWLLNDQEKVTHPLIKLRQYAGFSQIGFCKAFCVNAGLIHKWEAGKQHMMPKQLIDALVDAGYSDTQIKLLEKKADAWTKVHA